MNAAKSLFARVLIGYWFLAATCPVSHSQTPTTLWYNGNLFGQSSLRNQVNAVGIGARVFDDFIVPEDEPWIVTSIWSNDWLSAFGTPPVTSADWSIRKLLEEGDDGIIIASGISPATRTYTGRNPNFLYREYTIRVDHLKVALRPGVYWLQVTPVVGESFNSITHGAGAIGTPPGNDGDSFFDWPRSGIHFAARTADFSMGIAGYAVPEPTAYVVVGAALIGLTLMRRRFRAGLPGDRPVHDSSGIPSGPSSTGSLGTCDAVRR